MWTRGAKGKRESFDRVSRASAGTHFWRNREGCEREVEEESTTDDREKEGRQCKSFKTRADEVKDGLEKGVPGIKVLLNPDKPRKGCFEIREEGGETFISLLDMERPFSEMEELNMEEVIADIIEKIK